MVQLSAMHLSNNRRYEIQRVFNFDVTISGLGDDVTLNVIRCNLPEISTPAIEVPHGNTNAYFAGRVQWGTSEIVVRDTIGADIEAQLNAWRRMVYNEWTDEIGWAADYQKEGLIKQYSPDGSVVRMWRLSGLWPETVNFGTLDMESSEKKVISMTMKFQRAYRI